MITAVSSAAQTTVRVTCWATLTVATSPARSWPRKRLRSNQVAVLQKVSLQACGQRNDPDAAAQQGLGDLGLRALEQMGPGTGGMIWPPVEATASTAAAASA
jgi:hypothetical protein